jgi:hypothetical protein
MNIRYECHRGVELFHALEMTKIYNIYVKIIFLSEKLFNSFLMLFHSFKTNFLQK